MRASRPILVVGAGIAGLTAALALARRRLEVRLVERAGQLEEVGAGLQLSPNALRVLDRLDVLPAVRRAAVAAEAVTLLDLPSGRTIARVPVTSRDGTAYLSLMRADLQAALLAAVLDTPEIRLDLGHELRALRKDGGETVVTLGRNGTGDEDIAADAIVAADGVRSTLGRLAGKPAEVPTGHAAWRMMVETAGAPAPSGIRAWLGQDMHAVAYPVAGGRRSNLVIIRRSEDDGIVPPDARLAPALRDLVERGELHGVWPLASAERLHEASDPAGLVFIGDAAHAMPPYAAQGAALAIEDGFVLAHHLAEAADTAEAIRRFAADREARWRKVRQRVAFHRRVYHLAPPLAYARDLALRLRSPAALAADLAWLYDWRPPSH
ncbi:salicylate hydroxylase [Aureimonas endophytica]|uniref:Salicylate hydroxylase n=1 Tax=Aureimonas endophytica TaxID=2027858 RepID=A0A916ZDX5_9HYPH|nr:FAD-dependent monooxygenase [Aureimonas endophytica]GGD90576.1 salicylate hydroxylase [Aureimonas endophytica]